MVITAKVDGNQSYIVGALRHVGANVEVTSNIGHGFPDLVVGYMGSVYLLEVKTPTGELTPRQRKWHRVWHGYAHIVHNSVEALKAIGVPIVEPMLAQNEEGGE